MKRPVNSSFCVLCSVCEENCIADTVYIMLPCAGFASMETVINKGKQKA